jgi:hypothetical protein
MSPQVQISAVISRDTQQQLEEYAEAHGVKKAHVIEQALLHYLLALRELPEDVTIPPRIVVSAEEGAEILELVRNPPPPTPAMRDLLGL